ncbi:PhoU domain-containing protein [Rhodocaloribacter sp.]
MLFFDRFRQSRPPLIRQAFDDVHLMLNVSHRMFVEATAALLENEILQIDLHAEDEIVNRKEREIRRAVYEHLSRHPQRELELSLTLLCIIQDVERIGDMAKSFAETSELAHKTRISPLVLPLRTFRDRIGEMFSWTRESFARKDEQEARRAMEAHTGVKLGLSAYVSDLADRRDVDPNEAVVLALAARLLSRTSSHLSNIASSVALPFDQLRCSPTWT